MMTRVKASSSAGFVAVSCTAAIASSDAPASAFWKCRLTGQCRVAGAMAILQFKPRPRNLVPTNAAAETPPIDDRHARSLGLCREQHHDAADRAGDTSDQFGTHLLLSQERAAQQQAHQGMPAMSGETTVTGPYLRAPYIASTERPLQRPT